MGTFFDSIEDELLKLDESELAGAPPAHAPAFGFGASGPSFGAEYSDATTVKAVQAAVNAAGYTPALNTDGLMGPKTIAGIKWIQAQKGIATSGVIDSATLKALSIKAPPAPTAPPVKIATVIAALRQAGKEKGYTLSDPLLSLMIGQLRGAEGAYPGVKSSLGGTNNMGAAQVTSSLASAKKGLAGWGAFAHKDSDPNKGAYIGWYWIAPNPLEAARHWLNDNWWGAALAKGNPQNATDYAAILYRGGYFGGMHPGDTAHDPNSDAGKLNVADYARAIQRGVASQAELAAAPDDPTVSTVDPTQFAPLASRAITQDLFTKAQSGGIGSAWKYLLPSTWEDLVKSNGAVWFGPAPAAAAIGILTVLSGLVYWVVGGAVVIVGAMLLGHKHGQLR
jgi:Putative peptidoglycan binding domain